MGTEWPVQSHGSDSSAPVFIASVPATSNVAVCACGIPTDAELLLCGGGWPSEPAREAERAWGLAAGFRPHSPLVLEEKLRGVTLVHLMECLTAYGTSPLRGRQGKGRAERA